MNRIYRSIWNQATGAYAAVSENVKSAGKRSMPGSSGGGAHFALTSMAAALMLGYGSLALALAGPAGGTVVAGQASINGTPGNTVIQQGSQNAVINWASFNIGKGESVQFQQPNSNAVALNRVLGNDGTTILGNLSANGKVFIVNPNGVLFGHGASVNTAGLVASTLDISNADFMAGKYQFAGNGTGKVLNQGSISAPGGYVALLGAQVSNEGTIQARLGSVALAAGRAITLDVAGDGLLNVAVDRGAVGALVNNGGLIQADGGSVVLTAQAAGDLLKTVVNNTGVIEAHSIDTRGGTIKLLGDMQSGTVNAAGTLDASAPEGGNGGFIDTSAAHVKIDDGLKVTTASAKGATGMWLIDPTDFTIAASGGNQTGAFYSNALKSSNVTIATVSSGGAAGNINVNDTISWSANKLTLTAHNNININAPLRGSGTASLALEYGQSGVAAGNLSTYNVKAEVDLPSGNNFSTRQGTDGAVISYTVINSVGTAGSLSAADLQGMNANLGGNYALGRHIDANATLNWGGGTGFVPIGGAGTPFTGRLDGLGHDVTGLSLTRLTDYADVGMFGAIGASGVVRNLNLVNTRIQAPEGKYGQIRMGMLAARNAGLIDNVSAYGELKLTGYIYAGGLVGVNSGVINNSRSSGSIEHSPNYGGGAAGLVAENQRGSIVSNSSSSMTVTVVKGTAGGLVLENAGTIAKSFATGDIAGDVFTGGLAAFTSGNISDSYATGSVTGSSIAGGLAGRLGGTISNSYATGNVYSSGDVQSEQGFGGLVGDVYAGRISNSYATGSVNAGNYAGGIVGRNRGSVDNVYSFGAVNAQHDNRGGIVGYNDFGGNVSNAYYNSSANHGLTGLGQGNGRTSNIVGLADGAMRDPSSYTSFNFTTATGATGNNWVTVGADGSMNGKGGTLPMFSGEYSTTINSPHQLQLMAMDKAAAYTLGSSFSAGATAGGDIWTGGGFVPVGDAASPFTGSLNGAGHIISDLRIFRQGGAAVGLIGSLGKNGSISDLGLSDARITGGSDVGALAGASAGKISGSFVTGNVAGDAQVGALVGSNTGEIVNSYAAGSATGGVNVGGLAGDSHGGSIRNSYAAVAVSGATGLGGLAGGASAADATGSYWDTQVSGQAGSQGGTGLSSAELKKLASYNGSNGAGSPAWDLNNTWVIYEGQSTPLLRSFLTPLVVTVSHSSKVYDGLASDPVTVSYSRVVDPSLLQGSLTYDNASGSPVNAGNYVVRASGVYSSAQNGYLISYVDGGVTITPRQISLNGVSAGNKVYDGNTSAVLSGGSLSGVLGDDVAKLNFLLSGSYASKNVGNNLVITASATLGGSAAGNYTLAPIGDFSGAITRATISSVTGLKADDKVYDGGLRASLSGASAVLHGMVSGDSLAVVSARGNFADKNAGSGKTVYVSDITLAGADSGNYILAATDAVITGTIRPKALTLDGVAAQDKIYDGKADARLTGGTLSGFVGSENVILSGLSGYFSDKNAGNGKAVTVGAVLASDTGLASNYTVASPGGLTASITPKALTVMGAVAGDKVYDGTRLASVSGGVLSGLVDGERLDIAGMAGSFGDKNAGNGKAVTVTGTALADTASGLASNYTVADPSGLTASITPKAVTVTGAVAGDKVYDGTRQASISGGTLSGLVEGERLGVTGMTASFGDRNAGKDKAVTVTGTALADTASGLASNYTVADPSGLTASITPKALTVTGALAGDKVYDGTRQASVSGGTLSGLVDGERLDIAGMTASFGDKNAGKGKTVTVTGTALADTASGLASNYTVASPGGLTASITPKALTVTGAVAGDKVYDGTRQASISGGVLSGLVDGERLDIAGMAASFGDKNAGKGKAVTVTGTALADTASGLASNYTVTDPSGLTASITPKALTVTGAVADDKVYDGTRQASISGGTLSGLVDGERLDIAGMAASFGDKNAGKGKAVTVTGTTLADTASGSASNYTVADPSGLTASITPKALTVTGAVAGDKVYDGTRQASLSGGVLSGLVEGERLDIAGMTASFGDKNAGKGKAVTVTGTVLVDTASGSASNYTVADPGGLTASITPAALTVAITGVNKVYDASVAASVNWRDDRLAGDQLSISSNAAQFADKNAGQGKTVRVDGIRLSGLDAGNYVVNTAASTRADIAQAKLTVTVNNAEKDQGRPNPVFDASYAGLLAGDSVASELRGELLFSTDAGAGSPAGNYRVAAAGQTSNNYAIGYVAGSLKVKPAEALRNAVTAAAASVAAVPLAGNMVVAEHAHSGKGAAAPAAPVVAGTASRQVLPGLQLSVLDGGILLPAGLASGPAMP
ncbi:YDG domain-containing protein [Janthinobacterium sp. P210006]|uniref:YDG domain-containing protein n=1 Tax=Janthinobacterium sp. P210006 TaxID=3112939 RepID=UPI002E26F1C2|nr:YDG domain-containing protein [Janthinobacterium sp. P210006]